MDTDERALKVWNEARAAAMASGVYPADVVNSILLSRCVALLERLVEQTAKPEAEPAQIEVKQPFPGQRFASPPGAK